MRMPGGFATGNRDGFHANTHLDFESVQFGVPIWAGTKPYQQICFQFSLHRLDADDTLEHTEFLDLSGSDPSEAFARALIQACGTGPEAIYVFNAAFEQTRISELAGKFPDLQTELLGINSRIAQLGSVQFTNPELNPRPQKRAFRDQSIRKLYRPARSCSSMKFRRRNRSS